MDIALILLAAGDSRRFGSNKLLHEVDGRPMYLHTLEKLAGIVTKWNAQGARFSDSPGGCQTAKAPSAAETEKPRLSLTVVTQYETIAATAKTLGAAVFYNPRPWEGISSSLKIGLRSNLDADFALFAVADQPRLSQRTLENVLNAARLSGKGMACASYGDRWGNPCIFSKKYFPELLALAGDLGGKRILLAHPEDVACCPVTGPLELVDVDTPVQLQGFEDGFREKMGTDGYL